MLYCKILNESNDDPYAQFRPKAPEKSPEEMMNDLKKQGSDIVDGINNDIKNGNVGNLAGKALNGMYTVSGLTALGRMGAATVKGTVKAPGKMIDLGKNIYDGVKTGNFTSQGGVVGKTARAVKTTGEVAGKVGSAIKSGYDAANGVVLGGKGLMAGSGSILGANVGTVIPGAALVAGTAIAGRKIYNNRKQTDNYKAQIASNEAKIADNKNKLVNTIISGKSPSGKSLSNKQRMDLLNVMKSSGTINTNEYAALNKSIK